MPVYLFIFFKDNILSESSGWQLVCINYIDPSLWMLFKQLLTGGNWNFCLYSDLWSALVGDKLILSLAVIITA